MTPKKVLFCAVVVVLGLAFLLALFHYRPESQGPPGGPTGAVPSGSATPADGADASLTSESDATEHSRHVGQPGAVPSSEKAADALYQVLGELVGGRSAGPKTSEPTSGREERGKEETEKKSQQQEEELGPGEITGEVTWPDGKRASGAFIEVTRGDFDESDLPGPSVFRRTTSTDVSGRFSVSGLRPAKYLVRALMPEAQALRTCDLNRSPRMHIQMELEGTGSIAGIVVDSAGDPVAGAKVFPHFSETEGRAWRMDWGALMAAITDNQGRFRVDHLWSSGGWQLLAHASGFAPTITELVPVGTKNLRIVLQKGSGTLNGIAIDAQTRRPVPGIEIILMRQDMPRYRPTATTDTAGRFQITGLVAGQYHVRASGRPLFLQKPPPPVQISGHGSAVDVTIEIISGATVSGRVTDRRTRLGVSGAVVTIMEPGQVTLDRARDYIVVNGRLPGVPLTSETDATGAYSLSGLPAAEIAIIAVERTTHACGQTVVSLRTGETRAGVNIEVDAASANEPYISGRVVDGRGTFVASAEVRAVEETHVSERQMTRTDGNGNFTLRFADTTGVYWVQALHGQASSNMMGPFRLSDGNVEGLVLTLIEATASVEGTVVWPDGRPVIEALVTAVSDSWSLANPVNDRSGQLGRFKLTGLLPGRYTLSISPSSWSQQRFAPVPHAGEVELAEGQQLTGIVLVAEPAQESDEVRVE